MSFWMSLALILLCLILKLWFLFLFIFICLIYLCTFFAHFVFFCFTWVSYNLVYCWRCFFFSYFTQFKVLCLLIQKCNPYAFMDSQLTFSIFFVFFIPYSLFKWFLISNLFIYMLCFICPYPLMRFEGI